MKEPDGSQAMIQIQDLTYRAQGRLLFDAANATIPDGHRVAIIGRNGSGKSTLLSLILGDLSPDGGDVSTGRGQRIATVAQEAPSGNRTLLDTVLDGDRELRRLQEQAALAVDPAEIADIHARLSDIDAHGAPARAARILSGLGFDVQAQAKPCSDFSGGWRMRVALAAALFANPDILLLDEPTNHLDLEASLWLTRFLREFSGTLLLVSHDREILDAVPTTTIHIDHTRLVTYAGGYERFQRTRQANLERLESMRNRRDQERRHMQAFVDRFRAKATKARQAQSRMKALERMPPILLPAEEAPPAFGFPDPGPLSPPLITLDGVSAGYDGTPVLRNLMLDIGSDDRIALLGANGQGKSTLIRLLAGQMMPLSGKCHRAAKLRVGYFAQHQAEHLSLEQTTLDLAAGWMPTATTSKIRAHLARFGLSSGQMETRVGDLSGGERARLLLALVTRDAPHILLLDEPTNHLDLESRDALVRSLNAFNGAIVLVTHDASLISLTIERLWIVDGGTCIRYDGDLESYRSAIMSRTAATNRRVGSPEVPAVLPAPNRRDERRAAAERRAETTLLRQSVKTTEMAVLKAEQVQNELNKKLAEPELYNGPGDVVTQTRMALVAASRQLEAAMVAWIRAQEVLDEALARNQEK